MNQENIKTEKVGYLKSKLNLMQGTLELTPSRLVLKAHKSGVGGLGLIGALIKRKVEQKKIIFDLALNDFKTIKKGQFGVNKNVLEITDTNENLYRIIVKDFNDWFELLKK